MNCEKCGSEMSGKFGSGRFCSVTCARQFAAGRKHRKYTVNKYRKGQRKYWASLTGEQRKKRLEGIKGNLEKARLARMKKPAPVAIQQDIIVQGSTILLSQEQLHKLAIVGLKHLAGVA